jgi:hypothetical protein
MVALLTETAIMFLSKYVCNQKSANVVVRATSSGFHRIIFNVDSYANYMSFHEFRLALNYTAKFNL